MQFSKIAQFFCVFALMVTVARAEDNPDQAAARAALVSKLFDMSAASTNNSAAPASSTAAGSVPAFSTTTIVKPAVKKDEVVMHPLNQNPVTAYTSVPPVDNGANFHVLRSPRMDIQSPPMAWTKTEARPVYAPAIKKTVEVPASSPAYKPVASQSPTQPHSVSGQPLKPVATDVKQTTTSDGYAPIVAPASPLATGKQQKLLDLLAKYKADQITPEQYHRQRAAIINGM